MTILLALALAASLVGLRACWRRWRHERAIDRVIAAERRLYD